MVFIALAPATVPASELSASITLTSEYIFRGQAMSGGNPAFQVGVDYEHDSGLFAGIWGSTLDLDSPSGARDAQVNYYAGYHFATDSTFAVSLAAVRYTFPGQPAPFDYDYTEAMLTGFFGDNYSVELGYSNSIYGFDVATRHIEARGEWPLRNAWVISAGVGYNDPDVSQGSGHLYWDAGASARWSRLTVDLRWYDNETPDSFFSRWSAESQVVATLSVAF